MPKVYKYILEHLININRVLLNIELLGYIALVIKLKFCQKLAKIVRFIYRTYR